ncbi:nucleotidyltransferase domain-containing protein [Spirulina sp. CS-785/01]|uniref:nucleotidyltransferase family protein n=1 Tax=Spirulina sp. CS-785/01 TaxID=3021716 RepID=UPI00232D4B68|nr:nucleotidyltransferase domain-containing protein [Spirulina sp. CS-785/01]MDB9313465.1 nucleotidyltransferase domain-containing protein [Spirulina sp. CS-785/01]
MVLSWAELYQRLNVTPQQILAFCEKWNIRELALFGSILRDDFQETGNQKSDVDVLFTYGVNARKNLLLQVRMKDELQELFGRPVDLVSKTALEHDPNYIRRHNILNSSRIIYAAR